MSGLVYYAIKAKYISKIRKNGLYSPIKELVFTFDMYESIQYIKNKDDNSRIIILAVKQSDLQPAYVFSYPDGDFINSKGITYGLKIEPNLIGVINFKTKSIDSILNKRISTEHYYC